MALVLLKASPLCKGKPFLEVELEGYDNSLVAKEGNQLLSVDVGETPLSMRVINRNKEGVRVDGRLRLANGSLVGNSWVLGTGKGQCVTWDIEGESVDSLVWKWSLVFLQFFLPPRNK